MEYNRVNLNRAEREKLARIAGMGGQCADELIRYRNEHDGFSHIDELRSVPGFDDILFDKVKDHLFIGHRDHD